MRVSHLVVGGLLPHGFDHVAQGLYPLMHLRPGVSAHDLLEEVVGEDGVCAEGRLALDYSTGNFGTMIAVAAMATCRWAGASNGVGSRGGN